MLKPVEERRFIEARENLTNVDRGNGIQRAREAGGESKAQGGAQRNLGSEVSKCQ
jgi:hypothetical protein